VPKRAPPESPKDDDGGDLARAIAKLSPDEAQFFLAKLEAVLKKRRLQLFGYLIALAVFLIGMFFAIAYWGTHDGFVGWVFLIPFALVGVILVVFGKWGDAIAASVKPTEGGSKMPPL
jgi:hypothetical protein